MTTTTIPVVDIFADTFARVFKNLPKIFTIGVIPIVAYFGVTLVAYLIAILAKVTFITLPFEIVAYFIMMPFALAWMRFILRGEDKFKFAFGPTEQKFFAYYALLMVPVLVLLLIGLALSTIGGFASVIISYILILGIVALYTMLQLVFPAAALGDPTGLEKVWKESVPNYAPMLGINMIVFNVAGIPILIVLYLLYVLTVAMTQSIGIGGAIIGLLLGNIIMTPLMFIALALMVTAVALVYRRLQGAPVVAAAPVTA